MGTGASARPNLTNLALGKMILRTAFLIAIGIVTFGCTPDVQTVPTAFRGSFEFNKSVSVTYWQGQTNWPDQVKQQLEGMCLPTTMKIAADHVVVVDLTSGNSVTQQVSVLESGPNWIRLLLHSNFAQTDVPTEFRFDSSGFWLCERTLFPDYRERFERITAPQQ